jgi:hypothetical protein
LGGVAGGVVGWIAGFLFGSLLVEYNFAWSIYLEKRQRQKDLRKHFGDYYASERAAAWRQAKEGLEGGDAVSGIVVQQYYYGVFLDIGRGFPAMLTKLNFRSRSRKTRPWAPRLPRGSTRSATTTTSLS